MKTKTILLAVFTALLFAAVSCDSDDNENETGVINFSHSDCKDGTAKTLVDQMTFTVTGDNQLNIVHTNSYLSCTGQIFVESNFSNDTIYINENSTDNSVDCVCPYDLTYSIRPVEFGTYIINVKANTFELEVCEGMNCTIDIF